MKKEACTAALLAAAAMTAPCAKAKPMLTQWGEKITPENAWRNYPRPQMERENWTCLNGLWDYAITKVGDTAGRPAKWDGKILVPFALEAPLSGCGGRLLKPDEYLWYTRKLELDPKPGERILLHFGAVDYRAMVFLGHDEVMETPHTGGNLPFTADLTPFAKKGENTLTVLVWDPTEDRQPNGKQAFKTHGCFYTRMSGIWQTVWLETVPEKHIADYDVEVDIDKSEATFTFKVDNLGYADAGTSAPAKGSIEITREGKTVAAGSFLPGRPCTVKMPQGFKLWSPETPDLYDFKATFGSDSVKGYFAMRKIEKRKDSKGVLRFFLNNKPYFIIGTLDQGWWPDGLLTPPSEEAMAFDIQTLKDCGFNSMRKHIKVEPLRYYALCDRMGLLLLQDMPSSAHDARAPFKADSVFRYGEYRTELKDMMAHLKKVPSILVWVPYNEGWSQHDEVLTHFTLDFAKRFDPTRLVDGPSGWQDFEGGTLWRKGGSKHKPEGECEAADIVDMHKYRGPGMPDVNARRISFLGEFGGLGHPVEGHLWRDSDQGKAAKLGDKGAWGYGGMKDTATREGLQKTYLDLMRQLGEMADKGLGGSIYTQTTDVEVEINGILTYDRKVLKYDAAVLKKAHEEIVRKGVEGK